jgi:hypothetical protein
MYLIRFHNGGRAGVLVHPGDRPRSGDGVTVPSPFSNKLPNPSEIREMWICVPDLVLTESQFSLL